MQFWCGTAFLDTVDLPVIAQLIDRAGFHGIVTSDHTLYPRRLSSPYPTGDGPPWPPEMAWPDSWVAIGAMAAVTERLRFSNAVYIAGTRPLIEVAKQVATAAVLSRDRVSLAVGVGWMREEFDLLGQNFDNRGPRTDEMIDALRVLWQGGWVSWHGEYYDIPEMMIEPHPVEPVPILCGGESPVALRRAARHCDGWVGTAYRWDDAVRIVEQVHGHRRRYGRDNEPFEILLALLEPPSPQLYRRAQDIGISGVMCSPWSGQGTLPDNDDARAEHYRTCIDRFAQDVLAASG